MCELLPKDGIYGGFHLRAEKIALCVYPLLLIAIIMKAYQCTVGQQLHFHLISEALKLAFNLFHANY